MIDTDTMTQPDYSTQQHPFPASATHAFDQGSNVVQRTPTSGETVAAHQFTSAPADTAEDPLMLVDWSNWGLQSLFPQDPGPMGNEFLSDWFH